MFNTENLLRNEVFPAELPPCFSTDDLAANATLAIATSNSFGQGYSIPLTYSGYKSESSRRKFALPNPYHYCKAVDFIVIAHFDTGSKKMIDLHDFCSDHSA